MAGAIHASAIGKSVAFGTYPITKSDSQILAGAIRAGCSTLFSEDLQAGQTVRGVRIVNPFAVG
jgi:predicted nucleic acid-binding protein